MDGRQFIDLITSRRSVRAFAPTPIPDELLRVVLESAHSAPSGFNLQPWHFLLVTDVELKEALCTVAMQQRQVREAPAVLVFLANLDSWKSDYDQVLAQGVATGVIDQARANRYKNLVRLYFRMGPFGVFGFLKRLALPFLRLRHPFPAPLGSREDVRHYVCAQTMLAAQNAMLAAKSVGLETCPMEGFDEHRLKLLLSIPKNFAVPLIMPLGFKHPQSAPERTYRAPLTTRVHWNRFKR